MSNGGRDARIAEGLKRSKKSKRERGNLTGEGGLLEGAGNAGMERLELKRRMNERRIGVNKRAQKDGMAD